MDDPSAFEQGDVTDAVTGDDEPISRREPLLRYREGNDERSVRIEADTTLGSAEGVGVRLVHPTVSRLHAWVAQAGFRVLREERQYTGFFRRAFPGPLGRGLDAVPFARDVGIGQIQCVLVKP